MTDNKILKRKEQLRGLVDEFKSPPSETVYEQSVRYGQLAFEAFKLMLPNYYNEDSTPWSLLSQEQTLAWIEVGTQIERITLKENS